MTTGLKFRATVLPKEPPHKVAILQVVKEDGEDFVNPIPLDRETLTDLKRIVDDLEALIL